MAINLTFSGAGFLGIYHVGVVSCLKFYGTKLLEKIDKFGGSSAGALTACMLLCGADLEESVQFVMHMASKVHGKFLGPLNPAFDPSRTIRKTFLKNMPTNAYKLASDKLFISLTRVSDWKNVVVSNFKSNEDLVDALVCSCFIPMFSGVLPPKFNGEMYIDGGFTDNLPQEFGGVTITVSPFSGESDICPDDGLKINESFDFKNTNVQLTMHNAYRMVQALFPPNAESLCKMCKQGFRDTLKYLHLYYPDMLNLDAHIVSIPRCCESTSCSSLSYFTDELSDDEGFCYCRNSNTSYFSDIENSLAKTKVIGQLIFPEKLNSILSSAKELFNEGDMFWRFACALVRLGKWLTSPYYYFADEMDDFVHAIFKWLLPKLQEFCSKNYYMEKSLAIALEVYHAYHGTSTFQWHPTIKEERHKEILRSQTRILTAQQSLVLIPKTSNSLSNEPMDKTSAPPPTRINSGYFTNMNQFENSDDVFDSDDEGFYDKEGDVNLPHCVKDDIINNDIGLYFRLDESTYGFHSNNASMEQLEKSWDVVGCSEG